MTSRRKFLSILSVFFLTQFTGKPAQAATSKRGDDAWLREAIQRCLPAKAEEKFVYTNDFSWGMSMDDMKTKFQEIYHSGKRLKARAYYDTENNYFVLPKGELSETKKVRLTPRFLKSLKLHVENALKANYADYVFFPDMGHSHLLLPQAFYDREVKDRPTKDQHLTYEAMFASPEVKILYHTAEQLKVLNEDNRLLGDKYLQWRYFTRNLVGDNKGEGKMQIYKALDTPANTAGESHAHGDKWWGGGFSISSSSDGCFAYEKDGKTLYFDISLEDLPWDSSRSQPGDFM